MAGLKTFWITISALLFLAACVPQSKQTECGSNEAFNASLRTCVPIVGGPESFVQVANYSPASAVSKSKGDFSFIPLSISISNPYNQAYTITWERVYNNVGTVVPLSTCNNALACNVLRGYDLGTTNGEIGLHIVTAKVKVNGTTVDSHSFEVKVNDLPKPTIVNATVLPSPTIYNISFTPLDGPQEFSFTINNNSTLSNTAGWRTSWVVTKNGVLVTNPVMNVGDDPFTNFGSTQQNAAYLGTAVTATFNPSNPLLGVGSYTIRAIVQNTTPGEVVDERLWTVTVKHPDFGVVTNKTAPIALVETYAFHGLSYDQYGFTETPVPPAAGVKGNYCVKVSNPEGAYPDSSSNDPGPSFNNIIVRYYKNGATSSPIYENTTSSIDDEVCFSDASPVEEASLFFSDGPSTIPYNRTLTARVFDEQTGIELCVNGTTCPITYPLVWNITVKPQNTAPTVNINSAAVNSRPGNSTNSITNLADAITYSVTPTSSTTTASATVRQDTPFTLRFRVTDDALEHDPVTLPGKFKITPTLIRGGTPIVIDPADTTCTKDFADAWPAGSADAGVNSINVVCTFNLDSDDASGPLPPGAHTLTIQVEDLDSPATQIATGAPGNGGKLATLLTWNLTVIERQTAPTIAFSQYIVDGNPAAVSAIEGQTVNFELLVTDLESDSYTLVIKKCADPLCSAGGLTDFPGNSTTQHFGVADWGTNNVISYTIPEDAIGNVASGTLYFKAILTDVPSDSTLGLPASPALAPMSLTVNQKNDPPEIDDTLITPAVNPLPAAAYDAFAGNKFEINASAAVSDPSLVASENMSVVKYRWWISPDGTTWTQIAGAQSSILKWTPGPELTAAQEIKLCVTDEGIGHPAVTDDPSDAGVICSDSIRITPRPNLAKLTAPAEALNGEVAVHFVPGENLAYVAYASNAKIYVKKFTYGANGALDNSGMDVAVFNTVSSALGASVVKNLSITASSNHVYVAYLAGTALGSLHARVRMINISATGGSKTHTDYAASTRKFDFSYDPISVTVDCNDVPDTNCNYNPAGRIFTFDGAPLVVGDSIEIEVIHPAPFRPTSYSIPVANPPVAVGEICSNCSGAVQAQDFVNAINQISNNEIQGLSAAITAAGQATLYGVEENSFYDGVDVATAVGKIAIFGNRWYLPVVNSSLAGLNQNKIELLSDDLGDMTPATGDIIDTVAVSAVDNAITPAVTPNGRMLLSYITLSGSVARACLLTEGSGFLTCTNDIQLFGGTAMTSVKGSPYLATNLNNFFVGKDSSNVWRVARATSTLGSITREGTLISFADSADTDNALILGPGKVQDVDVRPALPLSPAVTSNEARLAVISNNGGSNKTYLMRWRQLVASPFEAIDSAESTAIESGTQQVTTTSKVVLSPVMTETIGSPGSVLTDNTNAYTMVVRVIDLATDQAEVGVINTEPETINSTTRAPAGQYGPALFR